jgi:deoxyribodipyrimidine photolyase
VNAEKIYLYTLSTLLADFPQIPAHDPIRYQTTDGFDEPDRTNGERAEEARVALVAIHGLSSYEQDRDCVISDQISNLLHLAHAEGLNLTQTWETALRNFLAEACFVSKPI